MACLSQLARGDGVGGRLSPDFVLKVQAQVDVVEVARGEGAAKAAEDLPAIGRIEERHGRGTSKCVSLCVCVGFAAWWE
jgi:hypothetical protein